MPRDGFRWPICPPLSVRMRSSLQPSATEVNSSELSTRNATHQMPSGKDNSPPMPVLRHDDQHRHYSEHPNRQTRTRDSLPIGCRSVHPAFMEKLAITWHQPKSMLGTQNLRPPHNQVTRSTATSVPLRVPRISWRGALGRSSICDYTGGFES